MSALGDQDNPGWRRSYEQHLAELAASRARWTRTPVEVRERAVLEALGEDRLRSGEIARRIGGDWTPERVRVLLDRMHLTGQVRRVRDDRRRFVYWRARDLHGAIAELERVFGEQGA